MLPSAHSRFPININAIVIIMSLLYKTTVLSISITRNFHASTITAFHAAEMHSRFEKVENTGWAARKRQYNSQNNGICKWYGAGFCKHAVKCFKRKERCVNGQQILDIEEAWLNTGKGRWQEREVAVCQAKYLDHHFVEDRQERNADAGSKCTQHGALQWLLVMDVEGGANDRPGEDEIIELPVMLLDASAGEERARFHRFIRQGHPGSKLI